MTAGGSRKQDSTALGNAEAVAYRFSLGHLPSDARRHAMLELKDRGVLPIEPLRDCPFQVDVTKWSLPHVGILAGKLCGLRQEASPHAQDASDDLFFGINLAGRSIAFQRGRETVLGAGEAVLLSCAERNFSVTRPKVTRFVGLRVAHKQLAPLVRGLDDKLMHITPATTESLQLLIRYCGAVLDERAPIASRITHAVSAHLIDLIALSLADRMDEALAEGSVRAARLKTIKADVAASLPDGRLTVAAVAARHGVTPRYVHKVFESEGTTYTQYVLRQRLDRAYRMLRDRRLADRSITSIAYDSGFDDLSYFSRVFRRQYGATPSDIKASA